MAKDKIVQPFIAITKDKYTIDNLEELKQRTNFLVGDIVDVLGYAYGGDGLSHKRIKKEASYIGDEVVTGVDGSKWALVPNSFGVNKDDIVEIKKDISKGKWEFPIGDSYKKYVIGLVKLTGFRESSNETFEGCVFAQRSNGTVNPNSTLITICDPYQEDHMVGASMIGIQSGIKPVKFLYNGQWYGGLEIFPNDSQFRNLFLSGQLKNSNSNSPHCFVCYYHTQTGVVNSEISNSITYDSTLWQGTPSANGYYIYHQGNKPSASDVNAVAKSGDTMSGDLIMNNSDIVFSDGHSIRFKPKDGSASVWAFGAVDNKFYLGESGKDIYIRGNISATESFKTYGRTFVDAKDEYGGSLRISLAIGDNDTGFNWEGDGTIQLYSNSSIAGYWNKNRFGFFGDIVASGKVTGSSDIKLKKDLEVIPDALDKIKELSGYTYTRKDSGERETGVVAQEVQKVLPEAVIVSNDSNGEETLAVAYGNMVGLLIEGIKEQQKQIEELKKRIEELEGR